MRDEQSASSHGDIPRGDILVTTERGIHQVSVVPHAPTLTSKALSTAMDVARRRAFNTGVTVWRIVDGKTFPLRAPGVAWRHRHLPPR